MNCLTPVEWAYGHTWFPLTWESLCENINPAKMMAEDGEPNLCCHYLFLPGQHCTIAYLQTLKEVLKTKPPGLQAMQAQNYV